MHVLVFIEKCNEDFVNSRVYLVIIFYNDGNNKNCKIKLYFFFNSTESYIE